MFRLALTSVIAVCFFSANARAQDPETLKTQARALFKQGDYARAIDAYKLAETAASRAYGATSQKTDIIVNELAMSHYKLNDYAAAIPLYDRVYRNTLNRRANENFHYDVATCLNNLGLVYDDMGNDVKAEEMYRTARDVVISGHGKNSPYVATELNNLAAIYRDRGDFVRALEHYQQSLELYQKQPVEELTPAERDALPTKIASALHNLAVTRSYLGQSAEAEKLYRESLRIRLAKLGPDHPSVGSSLLGLAGILADQGKPAEAKPMYDQALQIRRKKLGPDHLDVAVTLSNIAEFLRKQGDNAEAEKLHLEALRVREAKLGKDSVLTATTVHNLANLYRDLDRDQEALALNERSLKINRTKHGGEHIDVARSLMGRAAMLAKLERWKEAAAAFDESRRIIRKHNAQVLPALKPAEQLAFLKSTDEVNLDLALAAAYLNRADQSYVDLSAGWLLNAKGIAQQALAERETLARSKEDKETAAIASELERVRRELVRLVNGAGKDEDNAAALAQIDRLRAEQLQLVQKLAEKGGQAPQASEWVDLAQVRKNLPADGVLIQIARFRPRDFKRHSTDPERWAAPRFAAWLIPAANKGEVRLVDLGPADKIEGAVRATRAALENALAAIQADGEQAAEAKLRATMQPLTDLVLAPCLAQAGEVRSLFLNPDSSLWLVPFSALPLPNGGYVVEKYSLTYVVSGRDLLPTPAAQSTLAAPVIFADPDYDLTSANLVAAARAMMRNNPIPAANLTWRTAVSLGKVQRLAATAQEAALIAPRLQQFAGVAPVSYLGANALEFAVKKIDRPKVLVISTHGFFAAAEEPDRDDSEFGGPRRGKAAENPLLRCGLLFGGCNSPPAPNMEDGILNGMEIVRMDLRGTELVVLSACQTGLGQVTSGEGVAGLRQAFQLAGAKSVLATLWEIPDNDTARLMIEFFGQLADGKDKAAALRAAQIARIEARREKRGAAHPFYWGAFTLTGRQ